MSSLGVVVNSCESYASKTTPLLLESLVAANVPLESVRIVIGDSPEDADVHENGVETHRRRYCNLDNNGLLWVVLEPHSHSRVPDWIFYTHDTSVVAPSFWEECMSIVEEADATQYVCVKLHGPFSMSTGLYRTSWLRSEAVTTWANSIVNFDPSKRQAIKENLGALEDACFKLAPPERCAVLPNTYTVVSTEAYVYDTSVPRIIEFYQYPGIYKIKANHSPSNLHINL